MAVGSRLESRTLSLGRVVPRKKGNPTMRQLFGLQRSVLLAPLLVLSMACDGQPESPAGDSSLGPTVSQKAVSAAPTTDENGGHAKVEVVFNAAPRVESMVSSSGRVSSGAPVTLLVTASDADHDAIAFAWTSNCPGMFDRLDREQVTFVCATLSTGMDCTFEVVVSDGHGGAGKGSLLLSSAVPVINVAPAMGVVYQTTNAPDPAEVVLLHASATDPEGQLLTWTWKASDGTLADQKNETVASDVRWTAPATPGGHCTITATATDPAGASASYVFKAVVSGG